jgi:hypothetical protein
MFGYLVTWLLGYLVFSYIYMTSSISRGYWIYIRWYFLNDQEGEFTEGLGEVVVDRRLRILFF